jgi:hypothetical protein
MVVIKSSMCTVFWCNVTSIYFGERSPHSTGWPCLLLTSSLFCGYCYCRCCHLLVGNYRIQFHTCVVDFVPLENNANIVALAAWLYLVNVCWIKSTTISVARIKDS